MRPDPDGSLALTYEEFLAGVGRISSTTFRLDRTPEQAWPDFRGWRVNYDTTAYALMDRLDAAPGPWTGSRSSGDVAVEPRHPANRTPTPHVSTPDAAGSRSPRRPS